MVHVYIHFQKPLQYQKCVFVYLLVSILDIVGVCMRQKKRKKNYQKQMKKKETIQFEKDVCAQTHRQRDKEKNREWNGTKTKLH